MTEPERPAGGATGNPTPEEISARLEALLKRTHTLRAQRAATEPSGGPLGMAWPPPERELDHYDVVDVLVGVGAHASAAEAQAVVVAEPDAAPAMRVRAPGAEAQAPVFARPEWNELRLRPAAEDDQRRSTLPWVLTALLALATLGQAAYIWHLRTTGLAVTSGRLRVDGPDGAEVRVDGQGIGRAPVDQELEPGGYAVEVVHPDGLVGTDDVIIGVGRTVVLMLPATPRPAAAGGSGPSTEGSAVANGASGDRSQPRSAGQAPAAAPGPAGTPVQAAAQAVSATMGAVLIESTPPGQAVTMGGRPRGVTPLTIGLLRPGRHDVIVGGAFRRVDVVAGEVATLRVP